MERVMGNSGWLPGRGLAHAWVICLPGQWERDISPSLKEHFPSLRPWPAVDFRGKGRAWKDYDRLPFPTASIAKEMLVRGWGQVASWCLGSPGGIGYAQTWCAILRELAQQPEDDPRWSALFDADAFVTGKGLAAAAAMVASEPPLPTDPAQAGAVFLGSLRLVGDVLVGTPRVALPGRTTLRKSTGLVAGSHGVLVNPRAAAAFLAALTPIEGHLDARLTWLAALGVAPPVWVARPMLVEQPQVVHSIMEGKSTITKGLALRAFLPKDREASNAIIWAPTTAAVVLAVALTVVAVLWARDRARL